MNHHLYSLNFSFEQYESSEEKEEKFTNFKEFLSLVDTRNAAEADEGGSARHGITIFADISNDEFKSAYLGYKASDESTARKRKLAAPASIKRRTASTPTAVDWSGILTTEVKDQGYCGSCWYVVLITLIMINRKLDWNYVKP